MKRGNGYTISQWDKWLTYIQTELKEVGYKVAAQVIGTSVGAVRQQLKKWRKQGKEVPTMTRVAKVKEKGTRGRPELPDGSTAIKTCNGTQYQYRKIEGKWIMEHRVDGQPKRVNGPGWPKTREKVIKEPKVQKQLKQPKKQPIKLPTRIVDSTKLRTIKVDSKTSIQIAYDKDPEEAISKWHQRHEEKWRKIKAGGRIAIQLK